jgi:lipoprotein-anchoring transpeptidase ErfK/SrfK
VDLDEQTLVAYRGQTPVYAALVAAGVWKYPTPVGTFRIYKKVAEADMKSDEKASEKYRVDHVPWTLYFKQGYALHGAYWHNGFGHARSHGCINLSPADARAIYHFARPVLPDGWTSLVADAKHPGTVVRIRGKAATPRKRP